MKTNYILIDLENVQPKNLEILKGHDFRIIVFVGSKQAKISFELAESLQRLGGMAEYIKIEGDGPNALDFHIAYYIGHISAKSDNCFFHIISKDSGFDPLVRHLKSKRIYALREKDLKDIPMLKISNSKSIGERVAAIIAFLKTRGNSKPRTIATLSNSINSLFQKKLEDNELSDIIDELVKSNLVIKSGNKITYQITT